MRINRKRYLAVGVIAVGILLICSLSAFDDSSKVRGTQSAKLSAEQIDPFDLDQAPEIEFVDGVPIFPWARPVVILQGSDFDMGYQYGVEHYGGESS